MSEASNARPAGIRRSGWGAFPTSLPLRPGDGVVLLLAALMLLVPAVGVPHEYILQDTLKSMMVALGALGAAWLLLWQNRQRNEAMQWHSLLWLPLLLMVYALGSMAWSHTYLAAVEAVRWFVFALLLWVGLNTLSLERLPLLATGIHWGAVLASLWVALQFWLDLRLFPQAAIPASTFVNRNFFAEFVVSTLPFSVLLAAQARGAGQIALRVFITAFNVLAVLMTGTRSALVAVLLLLLLVLPAILFLYRDRFEFPGWRHFQKLLAVLILLGTVFGLGSMPTGNPQIKVEKLGDTALQRSFFKASSLTKKDEYVSGSASFRLAMWQATGRLVADHPLVGVGAGAWEVAIPPYQTQGTQLETDYYAHNEILQLLAEYGLVGWLFLLALVGYLLRAAWVTWRLGQRDPGGQEAPWRAMTLAALLAFLLVSNAGFPWRLASTGALFALCLAILGASDLRLAQGQRHSWVPSLPWRPRMVRVMLVLLTACMALTVWISLQAAACESRLVGALKIAIGINQSGDPMNPQHEGRKAEILRLVREGIAINPHYRKITPMVADELMRWGDWNNARWIWESVAASRPQVTALLANISLAYAQTGELDKARDYYERARAIQPQAPVVRSLEVLLLVRSGQDVQAAQLSRSDLQLEQVELDLVNNAYLLGLRTRDWDLAIEALHQRRRRWPKLEVDSWYKLGQLYARPELHDEARAQQAFQSALDATPAPLRDQVRLVIPQPYRSKLR